MKRSKIAYCDYSGGDFNFVTGCTPISTGCANCYARAIYERFKHRDFLIVKTHPDKLARLGGKKLSYFGNGRAANEHHAIRPICFVCDTGDLFHDDVSRVFLVKAFQEMFVMMDKDLLILTKRAQRLHDFTRKEIPYGLELHVNIWCGVTTENQACFEERWPLLRDSRVALRWLSVEPMLGPIDLGDARPDWVVCGAESGPNRRPFDKAWAIDLKDQCDSFEIPYFFKQGSGLYPGMNPTLRGREWKAWPR